MANTVQIVISAADRTRGFRDLFKHFGDLEKKSKSLGVAFAYVGTVAAGALAASLVSAATASAKYTLEAIKSAEATGIMAERAGMAVAEFSKLVFSAGMAEVSQEDLVTASKKLSEELVRQGRGGESVSAELMRLADEFANTSDGAAKTARAVDLFGKSGQKLIPWLNKGSEAIRLETEEAKKFGLEVGPGFARQADEFGDNLDRMRGVMRGLWLQVAQDVLPTLIELTEKTLLWVKAGDNLEKAAHKIGFAFNFVLRAGEQLTEIPTIFSLIASGGMGSAKILADAWKKAEADMARAKEKMQELSDASESNKGEIVNEKDLDKALELLAQFEAARQRGASAIIAHEKLVLDQQLKNIERLQIEEDDKRRLKEEAEAAHQDKITDLKKSGETARAELDELFRTGQVDRYVAAVRTMEGAEIASLEARQALMQTYFDLYTNSLFQVEAATQQFAAGVIRSFSDGFGNAIASIATGAQTAEEAFASLGKQMLGMLTKFVAQLVVNSLLAAVLQKTIATATLAAIAPIASGWAAAATAASIATLGGASSAGALVPPLMAANAAAGAAIAIGAGAMHGGMDFVPAEQTFLLQKGERVIQPSQNVLLSEFLEEWKAGRGGGQPTRIELHLDGQRIADWIYDGTRDGRVQVHPRGVNDTRN